MTQMLYTKYRPVSLKDVQNQKVVTDALLKSIETADIGSAYLFTGGRGIGKTSIARAFARDLGIQEADIFELDAASNSGVDDMRQLGEMIQSRPYYSQYKMYILDEVHMLSKAAANAFLKILEEPPQHVIFVLATTDPQKLPETIVSRCLTFVLRKPGLKEISVYLGDVSTREGFAIDQGALHTLAIVGDGSYRDSLSYLQKILSASKSKEISNEDVVATLNITPVVSVFTYLRALDTKSQHDIEEALKVLRQIDSAAQNIDFFVKNCIDFLRTLFMVKFGVLKEADLRAGYSDYVAGEILTLAANKTSKLRSDSLQALAMAESLSKNSTFPTLPYELLLLQ
jgi:DNA polymerase-3 subunit gamma/tau